MNKWRVFALLNIAIININIIWIISYYHWKMMTQIFFRLFLIRKSKNIFQKDSRVKSIKNVLNEIQPSINNVTSRHFMIASTDICFSSFHLSHHKYLLIAKNELWLVSLFCVYIFIIFVTWNKWNDREFSLCIKLETNLWNFL